MNDAGKLWAVDPALAAAYMNVKATFAAKFPNSHLTVAQGFRVPGEQAAASSMGASPFNGTTSWSMHQRFPALAIDVAVIAASGGYVSNGGDARYAWVGHAFEALGFQWGGKWVHSPDYDHVQTTGHAPRSPAEAAAALTAYQKALTARPVTA
jgi:hypothetical protein